MTGWCYQGPSHDVGGKREVRTALRDAWESDPTGAAAGLLGGLMMMGALGDREQRSILRSGSEEARAEVLRWSRWGEAKDSIPTLLEAFEGSKSERIRVAAVHGLARALEYCDPEGVMAAGRDWLMETLEREDLRAPVRLAVLRALRTAARREPLGEDEETSRALRTKRLLRLLRQLSAGSVEQQLAAHEVIFAILEFHRRWAVDAPVTETIERELTRRVAEASDQESHGTALVQLARFHAITVAGPVLQLGEGSGSAARQESPFWRFVDGLTQHLARAEAGEGDWPCVAASELLHEFTEGGLSATVLIPLTLELIGYLSRSAEASRLTPALAYCFRYSHSSLQLLWDWADAADDPLERGSRLSAATMGAMWVRLEDHRSLLEGFQHDVSSSASFWRASAAAVAMMETRGLKERHPLVGALRLGQEQSWPAADLLPVVDALGMCATDEAARALLNLFKNEARGSLLQGHAARALGRVFEPERHDLLGHPMGAWLHHRGR
ncbi:MAG: hypothetical protein AAGG01_16250 [Planctomycetota bacterium]